MNLVNQGQFLALIAEIGGELEVLTDFPINGETFQSVFNLVADNRIDSCWTFVLQKEKDIIDARELRSLFGIENANLRPFYNRGNRKFFEKYVYIKDKDSLFNSKLSLKELHCRQLMNPLNFGKIFVKADGKIISGHDGLSNYSRSGETSIYEAIYNEMVNGRYWFKIRSRVKPCKNCIYNCFCPPLSNYESIIGQNNLCHIFRL